MTTLIAVYGSDGCEGRCDARCYEAKEPECQCICGGMNHGAGKDQAVANTTALAEQWIEQYGNEHDLDPKTHKWDVPARDPVQLTLF